MHDVIVVGAGPAGSTLAWALARHGVKTLVVDRAVFPREKVCGDYVEPRGLHLLETIGCLRSLQADGPLPITHSATYVDSTCLYRGRIPFYGRSDRFPPNGYIIPRHRLDHELVKAAEMAGAVVRQGEAVSHVTWDKRGVQVEARRRNGTETFHGRLVVGADGTHSVVAQHAGLLTKDPRHLALSQRAYAEGMAAELGEAAFYFDHDFFPGYGWVFPMAGGVVNLGVGILAETAKRRGVQVPQLFSAFVDKVRQTRPGCAKLRLVRPPIGGVVKTYGGAGPNFFPRGLLIGDAGSFVDPMTGEGITPAMESGLIAASVIQEALAQGRFDAEFLSAYEQRFRAYFDPSMVFLDLCAAMMRNWHLGDFWLSALARGCERSQADAGFARTVGAYFGGLDIDPMGIMAQVWLSFVADAATLLPRSFLASLQGQPNPVTVSMGDAMRWQMGFWESALHDPLWHARWLLDLQKKWLGFLSVARRFSGDPRALGLN